MAFSQHNSRHRSIVSILVIFVTLSSGQERGQYTADIPGLLAAGMYKQAEITARSEVGWLRVTHGNDSLEVATASDLLVGALILNGRAAHDESMAAARQTLRVKEMHLSAADPALVPSLLNLGDVLTAAAEFEPAIAVMERAVKLREGTVGADSLDVAEALDHLGRAQSAARRYDIALKTFDRSLSIKEKSIDPSDVALARTLEDSALVLQRMGAYDRAGARLQRAAAIQQAVNVDHPAYVGTLNLIAQQLWFEGQLLESKSASERAVTLAERTLRSNHPQISHSLRYLAATLADLGDTTQSVALMERAVAISEQDFGPNHHVTAEYLHTLAIAELREGAYAAARQRFQRVLSIFEKKYGPWHDYVATTLTTLAYTDASLGDYATALREQSRAVAIHERVGGLDHPFVATALTDLAFVYREEGLFTPALARLNRALQIREKALGPLHRDVARTLADLASTSMQMDQTTRAQAMATRALAIWEQLKEPNAPDYATVLALYAELQTRRGDYATAHAYFERAMAIRGKVFGASNPEYATAQAGLALALANLGDRTSAVRNAAAAEATGRAHLRTMLRSLPERQSLNYAAVRPKALDLILSLTQSSPEAVDAAMDGLIRSRALVLDEMAARHRSQRTAFESTDPLRTGFASAQQRLANLTVRGPGTLLPAQYTALVEDARRESEIAEQALAERSAEFRAERSRAQLGLDDVRAALPTDSALVSFVRYNRTTLSEPSKTPQGNSYRRSVPSYLALVMRAQRPPTVVLLGAAQRIDSLVSQWRTDIAAEARTSTPASGESARSSRMSGLALRTSVWDRLTPHLDNASRVFIVPDGALSLVPFAALPVGQRSYLLERGPVLHYLSAERDLAPPTDTPAVGQGLLALGGPAYDDSSLFASKQSIGSAARVPVSPQSTARSVGSGCERCTSAEFLDVEGDAPGSPGGLWPVERFRHSQRGVACFGRARRQRTGSEEGSPRLPRAAFRDAWFLSRRLVPASTRRHSRGRRTRELNESSVCDSEG